MPPDTDAGPAELRTILADDDPLARRVIRDTLQAAGIIVVAEAANGREAVELAAFYRPDVVLMDYMMPEVDGLEATRRLRGARPGGPRDHPHRRGRRGSRAAGARGGGERLPDEGRRAQRAAARPARRGAGEAAISRRLAMRLVERYRREHAGRQGLRPIHSPLTDREWEVMDLLCAGASTDDIARTLVLSSQTVRSHFKRIYRKLARALARRRGAGGRAAARRRSARGLTRAALRGRPGPRGRHRRAALPELGPTVRSHCAGAPSPSTRSRCSVMRSECQFTASRSSEAETIIAWWSSARAATSQ